MDGVDVPTGRAQGELSQAQQLSARVAATAARRNNLFTDVIRNLELRCLVSTD
jgi:hypothetical protein